MLKVSFKLQPLFLSFCFLYFLIPFETSNSSHSLQIRLFFILLATFYLLYLNNFKIKNIEIINFSLFYIFIFIVFSVFQSFSLRFFIFTIGIICTFLISNVISYNYLIKEYFIMALKYLIAFSVFMIFLQIVINSFTGNLIDFHNLVYPFSSARFGFQDNFGITRMGGIYLEPGTYSNYMYSFLILLMIVSRNSSKVILFFGAISIILSFSVWGMLAGSYLLILLLLREILKVSIFKKTIFLIISCTILFINYDYILEHPSVKFAILKLNSDTESDSVISKKDSYNEYVENLQNIIVIGEGFDPSFRKGETAPQDAGILLNISVVFGLLFTSIFVFIYAFVFFKVNDVITFFASLPIFFSKLYYWDYIFWILFFILFYRYKLDQILIKEKYEKS